MGRCTKNLLLIAGSGPGCLNKYFQKIVDISFSKYYFLLTKFTKHKDLKVILFSEWLFT